MHTINLIIDSSFSISAAVCLIVRKSYFFKASARHHPVQNGDKEKCKHAGRQKDSFRKSTWSVPFGNILFPLVATALLTGCPTHAKKVLVIGDSISHITSGQISIEGDRVLETDTTNRMVFMTLATGGIGAYHTKEDGSEYWGILLPNLINDGEFDAIVVQLGTNDCAYVVHASGDYLPYILHIVESIRIADSSVPILWLTMNDVPGYAGCAQIINSDLKASGVASLPYRRWAYSHPECFSDGIHPKEDWRKKVATGGTGNDAPEGYCNGRTEYAVWLKAQLDTFFGPTVN